MTQMDEGVLKTFVERLNAKLMDEARMRAEECARGLETPELGGLIVQKLGYGMAEALKVLEQVIDVRSPEGVNFDAATALVDPNWRENMQARWESQAGIDRATPRPQSAR